VGVPDGQYFRQPWMKPLFKLQMLMLAKMQWDARHCPTHVVSKQCNKPWPSKNLFNAVLQLRSPCVAGDLLRQRAPGLVQHTRSRRRPEAGAGVVQQWEVVEDDLCVMAPAHLHNIFCGIGQCMEDAAPAGVRPFDARKVYLRHRKPSSSRTVCCCWACS
jgi:hypothetical protein